MEKASKRIVAGKVVYKKVVHLVLQRIRGFITELYHFKNICFIFRFGNYFLLLKKLVHISYQ